MKRLLQYTSHKNNHTSFRSLTPRSRAHFTFSLLSLLIFFYSARITSYYVLLATLARSSLLVSASASRISYLARCFSRALYLWLACIHYMHGLHLVSTTVHASLLYLYTSHLVLRGSMHLLHIIRYTLFCTCTAYF